MHSRHFLRFFLISAGYTMMVALLMLGKTASATETLSFGVVPQQSAAKLARLWIPLIREVARRSRVKLQFSTARDIPTFERRLASGDYDIAYMNPYHYTTFSHEPGYRAIARVKDKQIKGIVVVRKDSPISDVSQLQGKTLAFPAPAAFAASILPRANFNEMGITVTPQYVGSHDSVYLAVARGLYPAGGGVIRTLKNLDSALSAQLRTVWSSDGYTPHAFAAHPRLDPEKRRRVTAALLALGDNEQGRAFLAALQFNQLERAEDSDWNDVRALGIRLLESQAIEETP